MQIIFLPWWGLNEALQIGPVTLWPFYKEAENRIEDKEILNYLQRYFSSYIGHDGNSVDSITVCSFGNELFNQLEPAELIVIRQVVDALAFSAISNGTKMGVCADNDSIAPPSADVFELITQNFTLQSDYIAISAGSLTSGGLQVGEFSFAKPWSTGGHFGDIDEEFIKGISKCFEPSCSAEFYERLFRSLEWFRLAHIEGGQVSDPSKLVMMATALEIILHIPRNNKHISFAEGVENKIASDDSYLAVRVKIKEREYSRTRCWAWDFYELRSKIVHGEQLQSLELVYKDWITYSIVADLVLWECIMRELFMLGFIGDHVRSLAAIYDKHFPIEAPGSIDAQAARWHFGFDHVHKALGWVCGNK